MTTTSRAPDAPAAGRVRRGLPIVAGILLLAVIVLVLGPSSGGPALDPTSAADDGLLGLVRLLEELDVEVEVALEPPADTDTVVFLPLDLLGDDRRDRFTDWMRAGGTLAVAGSSRFHEREELGTPLAESFAPAERTVGCDLPALEPVEVVRHDGWLDLGDEAGDQRCFPSDDGGAWLLPSELGDGHLLIFASADAFTNEWLDAADNAVLAAALFGRHPGDALRIVPRPPPGERDVGLLDLVAPGVWRGLLVLGLAVLVAVVARARRLGPPVEERLPAVLPSGELARSLAGLTARAGDRRGAAMRLRHQARERATQVLGLPVRADAAVIVERLVAVAAIEEHDARLAIVEHAVEDDDGLIAVARAVRTVLEHLDRPDPTTSQPTTSE